jgi:hypothetical protein
MNIEVTGCHDCPFCEQSDKWCYRIFSYILDSYINKSIPKDCPLQTESITIKKKEDEK